MNAQHVFYTENQILTKCGMINSVKDVSFLCFIWRKVHMANHLFSMNLLSRLVTRHPQLLTLSVEKNLNPTVMYLMELSFTR
jgi:hypothetical protein